jgi:hypothetical protein
MEEVVERLYLDYSDKVYHFGRSFFMFRNTLEKQNRYIWSIIVITIILIAITQWFPIAYFSVFALFLVGFINYKPTKKEILQDVLGLIMLWGLLFLVQHFFS